MYCKGEKNDEDKVSKYTTGTSDVEFALIDIDKNGVQEIVVSGDGRYHTSILAYVNGKVKDVGGGFAGLQQYYPNKKLYCSQTTHSSQLEYYYKFNGKNKKYE